jgi:hypothetical protein
MRACFSTSYLLQQRRSNVAAMLQQCCSNVGRRAGEE